MSQLNLIIKTEYLTDIKRKSFWISTLVIPIGLLIFIVFEVLMMEGSDTMMQFTQSVSTVDSDNDWSARQAIGLMMSMFLTLFMMMYGAQIFNKVKVEKTNRIVEVLATCVTGRTMMLAKIISVGLVGLTQLCLWGIMLGAIAGVGILIATVTIPWGMFLHWSLLLNLFWIVAFFIGGYIFYGSMFAAIGAMTDKNNENQEYVTILTFLLIGSLYVGMYAIDNGSAIFTQICSYLPFTSSTVALVNALTMSVPLWQSFLQLIVLYICAIYTMKFAGKIYTSSLLLKGKRFSPKDILVFLRSK